MTTTSTERSPLVRLKPEELIRIVDEALVLVGPSLAAEKEERLRPHREYVEAMERIGSAENQVEARNRLEAAETWVNQQQQPRWWIYWRKNDRMDSERGDAPDIVHRLDIPKQHRSVSIDVGNDTNKIEIRLSSAGASIELYSSDPGWLLNVELWARRQLDGIRPRYAWIMSTWARVLVVIVGALAAVGVLFLTLGDDKTPSAAAALAAMVFALFGALSTALPQLPGTIMSPTLGAKGREFRRELLWVVFGAILGLLLSEVWDAITAGAAPGP